MVGSQARRVLALQRHPAPARPPGHRAEGGGERPQMGRCRDGAPPQDLRAGGGQATSASTTDINRKGELTDDNGDHPDELPYIVVIIDELSDLMMVGMGKEVEDSIVRILASSHVLRASTSSSPPSALTSNVVTGIDRQGQHHQPHRAHRLAGGRVARHHRPGGCGKAHGHGRCAVREAGVEQAQAHTGLLRLRKRRFRRLSSISSSKASPNTIMRFSSRPSARIRLAPPRGDRLSEATIRSSGKLAHAVVAAGLGSTSDAAEAPEGGLRTRWPHHGPARAQGHCRPAGGLACP